MLVGEERCSQCPRHGCVDRVPACRVEIIHIQPFYGENFGIAVVVRQIHSKRLEAIARWGFRGSQVNGHIMSERCDRLRFGSPVRIFLVTMSTSGTARVVVFRLETRVNK